MKQIWVKMIVVDDPVLDEKVRVPDFGDHVPGKWAAVVGLPFGKHPDLPNFNEPLTDLMLVQIDDEDAARLEREAPERIYADDDVPNDIRLITELTLCGPKPELKRFRFDEDKAGAALLVRKDAVAADTETRASVRRVLQRMVAQGVMPEDAAARLAAKHELDEEHLTETPST